MVPIGRQRRRTVTAPKRASTKKGTVGYVHRLGRPRRFKMKTLRETLMGPGKFAVKQCAAGWYWNKNTGRCEKA